jgi:GNAT superfamily N-acetyltransferase
MNLSNLCNWHLRFAREPDIPALELLIPLSVRTLQAAHYSPAQMEAALGPVFGVDRQLIRDETYFVAEDCGQIAGCGGWSKRKSLFGSDGGRDESQNLLLDPACDAARIRAFFVHPDHARRGIGSAILRACESGILQAGFRRIELVATLAGEPLYARHDYRAVERFDIALANGLGLPAVRMSKALAV